MVSVRAAPTAAAETPPPGPPTPPSFPPAPPQWPPPLDSLDFVGGVGGVGLLAVSVFLLLATTTVVVMVGVALCTNARRRSVGSQLAHVVPVATIQFFDFASDLFLLVDFLQVGRLAHFWLGVLFILVSFVLSVGFVFARRELFGSQRESFCCALLAVFNLHLLFVGLKYAQHAETSSVAQQVPEPVERPDDDRLRALTTEALEKEIRDKAELHRDKCAGLRHLHDEMKKVEHDLGGNRETLQNKHGVQLEEENDRRQRLQEVSDRRKREWEKAHSAAEAPRKRLAELERKEAELRQLEQGVARAAEQMEAARARQKAPMPKASADVAAWLGLMDKKEWGQKKKRQLRKAKEGTPLGCATYEEYRRKQTAQVEAQQRDEAAEEARRQDAVQTAEREHEESRSALAQAKEACDERRRTREEDTRQEQELGRHEQEAAARRDEAANEPVLVLLQQIQALQTRQTAQEAQRQWLKSDCDAAEAAHHNLEAEQRARRQIAIANARRRAQDLGYQFRLLKCAIPPPVRRVPSRKPLSAYEPLSSAGFWRRRSSRRCSRCSRSRPSSRTTTR